MSSLPPGTVIVRLYLPLEMGTVAKVLKAIADEYPDATLTNEDPHNPQVVVVAMPGETTEAGG